MFFSLWFQGRTEEHQENRKKAFCTHEQLSLLHILSTHLYRALALGVTPQGQGGPCSEPSRKAWFLPSRNLSGKEEVQRCLCACQWQHIYPPQVESTEKWKILLSYVFPSSCWPTVGVVTHFSVLLPM